MTVSVKIKWNEAEFRRILDQQTVPQAVFRAAGKVRDRAKQNITNAGRVDTGAMRNSLVARRMTGAKTGVWYEVGSDLPYAIYQHEGTEMVAPIRPRRALVLKFKPKGGAHVIFKREVRGVKGVPFLTDALQAISVQDFVG